MENFARKALFYQPPPPLPMSSQDERQRTRAMSRGRKRQSSSQIAAARVAARLSRTPTASQGTSVCRSLPFAVTAVDVELPQPAPSLPTHFLPDFISNKSNYTEMTCFIDEYPQMIMLRTCMQNCIRMNGNEYQLTPANFDPQTSCSASHYVSFMH